MNVGSSRYPLIRISKTGEMRVKNKVGNAILKENAYEERALNTTLHALSKHQNRQDKYLSYRQLEFATKQVSEERARPRTRADNGKRKESGQLLPPVDTRTSSAEVNTSVNLLARKRAKGRWEKAIALVRVAVENREPNKKNFLEREISKPPASDSKHLNITSVSPLPAINSNSSVQKESLKSPRKKTLFRKQPSLPEMLKLSREKSQRCLDDPRFMKLEQCLTTKPPLNSR